MRRNHRMRQNGGLWAAAAGVAALLWVSTAPAAGDDWPAWRGPRRDGISTETGWVSDWSAGPPKTLWQAKLGQGFSTVSVVGDRVYTMGNADDTDTVWCLSAETGNVLWKHSYPCKPHEYPGPRCTPTVDGDVVYTLSSQGDLFCLKADTGQVVWNIQASREFNAPAPRWGFACSPLVLDQRLILDLGPLVALDKATGKAVWKSGSDKAGYASPYAFKLGQDTLLASFNEYGPIVVNAADGKELGRHRWETSWGVNAVTAIVKDDTVFYSSGYNRGAALFKVAPDGLKVVWENKNMRNHANNCVLWQGFVYGFDGQVNEGALTCIDFATGEKKWSEKSLRAGALMVADGKLLLMGSKGEVAVVQASPDGFKELGRLKVLSDTCWTHPVLSGGRLYCRNHPGDLICLDVRGK